MLDREFTFRQNYCHFSTGDKGRVVEVIQCMCCEIPLVLCKILDRKNSKYIWVEKSSLNRLIDLEV